MQALQYDTQRHLRMLFVLSTLGVCIAICWRLETLPNVTQLWLVTMLVGAAGAIALLYRGGLVLVISAAFGGAALLLAMTSLRVTSEVAFSDVVLFGASALVLFQLLVSQRRPLPSNYRLFLVGVGILLLGATISTALSADIAESMTRLVKFGIAALVLPLVIALWAPNQQTILWIVKFWVLSATISVIVGIIMGPPQYSNRIVGLATHPNTLALCAVLALGPALALTRSSSKLQCLLAYVAIGILAIGIVMSGSRAGLLGMASVLLFMLITPLRGTSFRAICLGVVFAVFAHITGFITLTEDNAITRLFSSEGTVGAASATQSDATRLDKYADAFAQIQEMPLVGVGLQSARSAHNVYLQLFTSSGALGLIGFLMAAYSVMRLIRPYLRFGQSNIPVTSPELMLSGLIASYFGMLVLISFQNALWERLMWIIPALILCLADQISNKPRASVVREQPSTLSEVALHA